MRQHKCNAGMAMHTPRLISECPAGLAESFPRHHSASPVWWRTAASHSRTRSPGTARWGRRQTGRWCKRCYSLSWPSSRRSRWFRDPRGRSCSSQRVEAWSRWGSRPKTGWCPAELYSSWRSLPRWGSSWCCSARRRAQPGRSGTRCLQDRQGTHKKETLHGM